MARPRMLVVADPPGSGKTTYFPVNAFGVDSLNIDDRGAQIQGSYCAISREVPAPLHANATKCCSLQASHSRRAKPRQNRPQLPGAIRHRAQRFPRLRPPAARARERGDRLRGSKGGRRCRTCRVFSWRSMARTHRPQRNNHCPPNGGVLRIRWNVGWCKGPGGPFP